MKGNVALVLLILHRKTTSNQKKRSHAKAQRRKGRRRQGRSSLVESVPKRTGGDTSLTPAAENLASLAPLRDAFEPLPFESVAMLIRTRKAHSKAEIRKGSRVIQICTIQRISISRLSLEPSCIQGNIESAVKQEMPKISAGHSVKSNKECRKHSRAQGMV